MNLERTVIHRKGAKNAKVRKENQRHGIFLLTIPLTKKVNDIIHSAHCFLCVLRAFASLR
jgi:hypothetical protein